MERLRSTFRAVHREYRRTVEWRSPLTGLYLMVVNSVFWLGVIYCDPKIQEALLATSSACIFAWDILLSSSQDRSIITHMLMWPFQSIFRTLSVGGSLYSFQLVRTQEMKTACYAAYGTLACLLINPVWEHNQVNQKIAAAGNRTVKAIGEWINYLFIRPIRTVYEYAKYIVLFQWVPPLFAYVKHFVFNFRESCRELAQGVKNWLRVQIIERSQRIANRMRIFFKYWFYAEWWPSLKEWLKINVGVPLRHSIDTIVYVLVYIFCAHWFPPLWRFTIRQLKVAFGLLRRNVLEPVKIFLIRQFDRFRCWLRAKLHQLAIAIRDSIVWPICLLVVEVGKQASLVVYNILLEPIVSYLYGRYKIIETSVLIYVLGPVCETVIEHIPEKNPFCDDSDVELDGFMPEVKADTDFDENFEEDESEGHSDAPSSSPLPEEEFEFEKGLQFSAVNGSESSDDEFDLDAPRRAEKVRRRKRREQGHPDDTYEILE